MRKLTFVYLAAKSSKGKNRIANFGDKWRVVQTSEFQNKPAIFVESLDGRSCRWVLFNNDPDFEITECLPS